MRSASLSADSAVLVVGGGLGGFHAAHALRRAGLAGEVTILGAETHRAYDRPPLSKAYLAGRLDADDLALDPPDAPLDATWVRGAAATGIVQGEEGVWVETGDGRRFCADAAVLATGADAIRIGPPAHGSHVLRTLDDAAALRADGVAGRDVVVVGGGFIALEVAATAVGLGAASTTIVSREPHPLAERFGREAATAVRRLHERNGVRFTTGVVAGLRLDAAGRAAGVVLDDATEVVGDLVVSGVGVRPATGWLADSAVALAENGAVLCDAAGRTSARGVWALGDCALWSDADGVPRRAGHWQDALDHAAVIAADLLGLDVPPLPAAYCWSDQHEVMLQVAGCPLGDEDVVVRSGSVETADLLLGYERDGVEVAVLGMNRQRDVLRWRRTREPRRRTAVTAVTAATAGGRA